MVEGKIFFGNISVCPTLMTLIKEFQKKDETLRKRREKAVKGELPGYTIDTDGVLRYQDRIYLPRNEKIKKEVLREAHCSKYTVHPENNKMYRNLILKYCWDNMKTEITQYISKCLTCQQVKAEH